VPQPGDKGDSTHRMLKDPFPNMDCVCLTMLCNRAVHRLCLRSDAHYIHRSGVRPAC